MVAAMSKKNRLLYENLPENFTVYRGYNSESAVRGFSWTINREKAEWFARRSGEKNSFIASLQISKNDVLLLLDDRNEQEVILLADWIDLNDAAIELLPNE